MKLIATSGAPTGITLTLACYCGGLITHTVRGREDRQVACPCGMRSDLRVIYEIAQLQAANDVARAA